MNKWFKKYLEFYNASLKKIRNESGISVSKLTGKKTNLKISLNLNTFYEVMFNKFQDNENVSVFISDDKELVTLTSDDFKLLKEIMFKYGGWIDDTNQFKHKYTLKVFEHNVDDENKINATI